MESKGSCLGRVPYISVIGFILIFVGGTILCGSLYNGIGSTSLFFKRYFFPVNSLHHLRIASVVFGALVIMLAVLVVIFSTLVTNATRGRIYRGDRFIMGGRFSAALFLSITYAAIVMWLFFLVFLVVPTFCWLMFNSICTNELGHVWHGPGARRPGPDGRVAPSFDELRKMEYSDNTYVGRLSNRYLHLLENSATPLEKERIDSALLQLANKQDFIYSPTNPYGIRRDSRFSKYIFNLTNYGIYIKPWMYDGRFNYREAIVSLEGFATFCDHVSIVGPLFACALGGAILVLFGLTLFVGSLSGFYTRLKLTKELTDFKQSFALRSPKQHDHAAYF